MNLSLLFTKIPRNPCLWSIHDVAEWLNHIGCGKYVKNFENQCFDGTLWQEVTDQSLLNDFNIKERISRVKIMKWVNLLKTQYYVSTVDGVEQLLPIQVQVPLQVQQLPPALIRSQSRQGLVLQSQNN